MLDITERKQVEAALAESERRYRDLFESAPIGMLSFASQGQILEVNNALVGILGAGCADSVRELNLLTSPPCVQAGISSRIAGIFEVGEGCVFETTFVSPWGRTAHLRLVLRPIRNGDGEVARGHGVVEDITERKQAESEREQLIQRLQDALTRVRTLSGFIPICSACKKVRNDKGYWQAVDMYVREHSDAEFSHSYCPDCLIRYFPDHKDDDDPQTGP